MRARIFPLIAGVFELAKKLFEPRLVYRNVAGIGQQVLLRNIGGIVVLRVFGEQVIEGSPGTTPFRVALSGGMAPTGRRGNLQYLADRLDPAGIPVLVDAGVHHFSLRSSSACAEKALAVRRISAMGYGIQEQGQSVLGGTCCSRVKRKARII